MVATWTRLLLVVVTWTRLLQVGLVWMRMRCGAPRTTTTLLTEPPSDQASGYREQVTAEVQPRTARVTRARPVRSG